MSDFIDQEDSIIETNVRPSNDSRPPRRGRREQTTEGLEKSDSKSFLKSSLGSLFVSTEKSNNNNDVDSIGKKTGWETEETPKNKVPRRSRVTKGEVDDIDDSTPKNTVIGKSDEDDVMVIIPDLMDVGEDDLVNTIATAPNVRPSDIVRTIGELENEMAASDVLLTQIQPSSIPGLDLSILISNAFCSLEQSEENDTVWDWDIVLNQVTMEMSK